MQLYGHYHREYFSTTVAKESRKPVATNFWGSSVASFIGKNPSVRIVEVDKDTMLPIDWEVHYYDIANPEKGWQKHYKYTEMYSLSDISPNSMLDLAKKVGTDLATAKKTIALFN